MNLFGIHVSAAINGICGLVGTIIPMLFLIALGFVWFFSGKPLQIEVSTETILPSLSTSTNWIALIAIMASFLGIQLAGVHVNDIRDPQRNFPEGPFDFLFISSVFHDVWLFGNRICFAGEAD